MPKIDTIIFDWDGTLAKTLDLWLSGYQLSLAAQGFQFEPDVIVRDFFHNHKEVPALYPGMNFAAIAELALAHVFDGVASANLYEGVDEALSALAGDGKTLTLVTSSTRQLLHRGLGQRSFGTSFASIVAGDDGFGHKPSVAPFAETLARVGARPKNTLIIGDTRVDIEAGQALGCQTCLFAPEHNSRFHDFEMIRELSPDHEVSDIRALIDLTR